LKETKMNKLMKKIGLRTTVALCVVALCGAAAAGLARGRSNSNASGRPEVKVALAGTVARGGEAVALDKAESVKPGEILDWHIASTNEGAGAARDYKAVGQIPEGTSFVAGSAAAEGGSTVTYSIDGGKTFSTQPIVEVKQADGTVKRVPAPVSMYTQVRYEWTDGLAAGGRLNASYKVRVK
jgi:uncharacterized repeat protein (TIGR01451 family)